MQQDIPTFDFPPLESGLRDFLKAFCEHAAQRLPAIGELRARLLGLAGLEVSLPFTIYPDEITRLIQEGTVYHDPIPTVVDGGHDALDACLDLWRESPESRVVVRGYALDARGIWEENSWVLEGKRVMDPKDTHVLYFGCPLERSETRERWEDLRARRESVEREMQERRRERERKRQLRDAWASPDVAAPEFLDAAIAYLEHPEVDEFEKRSALAEIGADPRIVEAGGLLALFPYVERLAKDDRIRLLQSWRDSLVCAVRSVPLSQLDGLEKLLDGPTVPEFRFLAPAYGARAGALSRTHGERALDWVDRLRDTAESLVLADPDRPPQPAEVLEVLEALEPAFSERLLRYLLERRRSLDMRTTHDPFIGVTPLRRLFLYIARVRLPVELLHKVAALSDPYLDAAVSKSPAVTRRIADLLLERYEGSPSRRDYVAAAPEWLSVCYPREMPMDSVVSLAISGGSNQSSGGRSPNRHSGKSSGTRNRVIMMRRIGSTMSLAKMRESLWSTLAATGSRTA